MKGTASLTHPLTDAEIAQLEDFLMSDSTPEEAMDFSMVDGFHHCPRFRSKPDDAKLDVEMDLGFGTRPRCANVRERRGSGEHHHLDPSALE
jgi:hypothetical protein